MSRNPVGKTVGYFRMPATPLVYALVSYYSRRYDVDRGTAMRAIITEFAQHDSRFLRDDFRHYVKKKIRPTFKDQDEAIELLDRDLERFLADRQTADSAIFHETTVPSEELKPLPRPSKKAEKADHNEPKTGSVARAAMQRLLKQRGRESR